MITPITHVAENVKTFINRHHLVLDANDLMVTSKII